MEEKMVGFVDGIDWVGAEAMKYWSYPAGYKKDSKTEIRNFIFSGDYCGALKVDGYYQRLIKDEDGNCFMIARNKDVNGNPINKLEWIPQINSFMEVIPNGTVFFCEAYLPGNEGSRKITSLLGCLKDKCIQRQRSSQYLHLYIFDVAAFDGENYTSLGMEKRIAALDVIHERFEGVCEYVDWATYYWGKELWEKLQEYLEEGREGIVLYKKDCPIYFKRTPARMTIKVKKEISQTIDCFFTGKYFAPTYKYEGKEIETWPYWINMITKEKIKGEKYMDYYNGAPIEPITKPFFNDWAGSLEIGLVKGDKVVPIGYLSNLTEEIKANPDQYKGRCIEVTCMEIQETGGLRHAKMLGFRDDLTMRDCTWEKVFGGVK